MKDRIYTIPVSEVLEHGEGCPLCHLYAMLEERCLEYITGAAMMEPDIRIKTNELGFCTVHFDKMMARRKSLQVALILESHLKHVGSELLPKSGAQVYKKKKGSPVGEMLDTCYVCDKIAWAMGTMVDTMLRMWGKDEDFRRQLKDQEYICLPHYHLLMEAAGKGLGKQDQQSFSQAVTELTQRYLETLTENVTRYCKMYDYRNSGEQMDEAVVKRSPQDAVNFLVGRNRTDEDEPSR